MKKIMIAACAIAMAAVAQAGTVTWGSGTLYPALGATGGWNNTDATKTVKAAELEVFMDVYFIDSSALATYQGKTQDALYKEFSGKTADLSGSNKNAATGVYAAAITVKDETATGAQTGVVIAHYHDATLDKDFYIATAAQSSWSGSTNKGSAGNLISGKSSAGWQVVPEPTSAMLVLLGVAGLALRRRRA